MPNHHQVTPAEEASAKQPRNKNDSTATAKSKGGGGATKHAALVYTLMTQRDSDTLRSNLQRQQKKLLLEL